jgi:methionyl-tRNA synthetase
LLAECRVQHDVQAINKALDAIWKVVADANRYFAGQEPWALKKTDPERMGSVLYVTAEILRQVAILVQPYMPVSAGKLLDLLSVPADARDFAALGSAGRLVSGTSLPAPAAIFPRYVEETETSAPA